MRECVCVCVHVCAYMCVCVRVFTLVCASVPLQVKERRAPATLLDWTHTPSCIISCIKSPHVPPGETGDTSCGKYNVCHVCFSRCRKSGEKNTVVQDDFFLFSFLSFLLFLLIFSFRRLHSTEAKLSTHCRQDSFPPGDITLSGDLITRTRSDHRAIKVINE